MGPPSSTQRENTATFTTYKRIFNTKSIESFKKKLYEKDWEETESSKNPDEAYTTSCMIIIYLKKNIKLKAEDLKSPWITRVIKKSSQSKQRLYEQFLKKRTERNELEYKNYHFESVKKHSKKLLFSNLILKYKNNSKKTWEIIKESIGKGYCNYQCFPKKLVIDKENIIHEGLLAKHFNTYFAQIGTNLAKAIETYCIKFESFLKKCDSIQPESPLSVNELKDAFFFT